MQKDIKQESEKYNFKKNITSEDVVDSEPVETVVLEETRDTTVTAAVVTVVPVADNEDILVPVADGTVQVMVASVTMAADEVVDWQVFVVVLAGVATTLVVCTPWPLLETIDL